LLCNSQRSQNQAVPLKGVSSMSWNGPESLGGQFFEPSALSAVSWAANRLDIFGIGSDRTLQHWAYDNGWLNNAQPESLGGLLAGGRGLSAVSWAANRLDIFAIGRDVTLQHWAYENGWLNNAQPESLGGDFFGGSGLSAVSWAANRLDIFAVSHGTLQHWAYENGWLNNAQPESLGGLLAFDESELSAVSWAPNRLDIFGISGHDDTLQHWAYDNGWLNNAQPESLGGLLLGGHSVHFGSELIPSLSAVSWAANRLDIFAIDLDATLQHWAYENGWLNNAQPETFGGLLDGNGLSAVSWGVNRLDIFGIRSLIQPPNTLQHWTKLPGDVVIPDLDPQGPVYKTEGPTDFTFYARPEGSVKAVMVFVDFSNAAAGFLSASDTVTHLLGNGQAKILYAAQSEQKLILDVTVRSDLGWRRMPMPSTQYSFQTFDRHRAYFTDAAALFASSEVNFSDYRFVFLVAPPNAGFPLSPAFNASPGSGAPSPSGEIRLGVTFGTDSYANRYINLVHEVGHLFGLPDLYPDGGGADTSKAGCWCIMSDIFHAVSFLGWHRHKNGWLSPSRKTYLSHDTPGWYTTLSPLSAESGLSMVVLPIDDALRPSRVFVVEVAQPVLGANNQWWGQGVLLYTVDATIPTGLSPVTIIPKTTSTSPEYGYLFEAPYTLNDTVSHTEGTTSLTLSILQDFGSSYYEIKIEYHRQ